VSAIRRELEPGLARILQAGTYLSVGLVAAGVILLIASGGSPLAGGPPLDVGGLMADVAAGRPAGLLWLGILGIVATPAIRVLGALVGFARRGEWTMVAVAGAILLVVATGVVAGLVTG
jgi:uncharacterized membrane protein